MAFCRSPYACLVMLTLAMFASPVSAAVEPPADGGALTPTRVLSTKSRQATSAARSAYSQGYNLFWIGNYTAARDSFDQAIEESPSDARAWYYKSFSESRLGRQEVAKGTLDIAVVLHLRHGGRGGAVDVALERVQGAQRFAIEERIKEIAVARRDGRIDAVIVKEALDIAASEPKPVVIRLVSSLRLVAAEDPTNFTAADLKRELELSILAGLNQKNVGVESLKTATAVGAAAGSDDASRKVWTQELLRDVSYQADQQQVEWNVWVAADRLSAAQAQMDTLKELLKEALQRVEVRQEQFKQIMNQARIEVRPNESPTPPTPTPIANPGCDSPPVAANCGCPATACVTPVSSIYGCGAPAASTICVECSTHCHRWWHRCWRGTSGCF